MVCADGSFKEIDPEGIEVKYLDEDERTSVNLNIESEYAGRKLEELAITLIKKSESELDEHSQILFHSNLPFHRDGSNARSAFTFDASSLEAVFYVQYGYGCPYVMYYTITHNK